MADVADTNKSGSKGSHSDGSTKEVGPPPSPFLGLEDYVNFEGYPKFRKSAEIYENAIYRYRLHRIMPMVEKAKHFKFKTDAFKKEICHILTKSFDFEKSELIKNKKYSNAAIYNSYQCMDNNCPIYPDASETPVPIEETMRTLSSEEPRFMCSELNKTVDIDKYPAYKSSVKHFNEYVKADSSRDPETESESESQFETQNVREYGPCSERWKRSYYWMSPKSREKYNQEHEIPDYVQDPMEKYAHLKGDISDLIAKYSFVFDPEYIFTPRKIEESAKDGRLNVCSKQDNDMELSPIYGQSSTIGVGHAKLHEENGRNFRIKAGEEMQKSYRTPSMSPFNSQMPAFTKSHLNFLRMSSFGTNVHSFDANLGEGPQFCGNGAPWGEISGNRCHPNLDPRVSRTRGGSYVYPGSRYSDPSSGIGLQGSSRGSSATCYTKTFAKFDVTRDNSPTISNYNVDPLHTQNFSSGCAWPTERQTCPNVRYQPCSTDANYCLNENRQMNCECQPCKLHSHLINLSMHYNPQFQNQYIHEYRKSESDFKMSNSVVSDIPHDDFQNNETHYRKSETDCTPNINSQRSQNHKSIGYATRHRQTSCEHNRPRSRSSSGNSRSSHRHRRRQQPHVRSRQSGDRFSERIPYGSHARGADTRTLDRKHTARIRRSRSKSKSPRLSLSRRRQRERVVETPRATGLNLPSDRHSDIKETASSDPNHRHRNRHFDKTNSCKSLSDKNQSGKDDGDINHRDINHSGKDHSRPRSQHASHREYTVSSNRRYPHRDERRTREGTEHVGESRELHGGAGSETRPHSSLSAYRR